MQLAMGVSTDVWHAVSGFVEQHASMSPTTLFLLSTIFVLSAVLLSSNKDKSKKSPPTVPSWLPFFGNIVEFSQRPIDFLVAGYKKVSSSCCRFSQYGPVFRFRMFGRHCTYLLGPDAVQLFFNSDNAELNAEDVYANLTVPVFGKGVAYDVPNKVFCEQKKIMKTGLTEDRFRTYVPLITEEVNSYVKRWGQSGKVDFYEALSEIVIRTASRCLLGDAVRSNLSDEIGHVFNDLDAGFTPEAWLLPSWLPLPSFRRRDNAHLRMKAIFVKCIQERRASGRKQEDMLQTLIDANYKDGHPLSDEEVSGMLIGLLLAGQHTSSTTSAWMGFFLAKHQDIQDRCVREQISLRGEHIDGTINYDMLPEMRDLDHVLKETLRMRPPLMTMMRTVRKEQQIQGFTIPVGDYVCVSPTVNHRLEEHWEDPEEFNPDRFNHEPVRFSYVPFGAGRHKCIGEYFAYVQIKTIWSELLRQFKFTLDRDDIPAVNYSTLIHTPDKPIIRYERRKL
jgi:sterol 14alpha-demethylase